MAGEIELLQTLYDRFNARNMEALLTAMREDVMWANGMEGGHVHGRSGVRDYWTRQWAMLDPRVHPVGFKTGAEGAIIVDVHQVVHDLEGKLLVDQMVVHVFRFEDGLIKRFDIGGA